MMKFEAFADEVVNRMKARLGDGYSVSIHRSLKNNSTVQPQLLIHENDRRSGPAIYLKEHYQLYCKNPCSKQMARVMDNISCLFGEQKEMLDGLEQWGNLLTDYRNVKEKILFKLVNTEDNQELLGKIPHIPYLDLSIVFYIYLSQSEEGIISTIVTNRHMEFWGITSEELYQAAIINTPEKMPVRFCSMQDVFAEIVGISKEELIDELGEDMFQIQGNENNSQLYVLSNEIGTNGAASLLYPGMLKICAKTLKKDLYILPSSVHEVLLVPHDENVKAEELAEMIQHINREEVPREDWLSDHAYFYNRADDSLIAV